MTTDTPYYGWTRGLNVPLAVHRLDAQRIASGHVLISMIDSTPRVGQLQSLVPSLERMGAHYSKVNYDVVVGGATLLTLIDDYSFFTGFDEIWLFADPPLLSKPETIRITSDAPLEQRPPDALIAWMREADCLAGLGDGDGLNFVTFDLTLAELWREGR